MRRGLATARDACNDARDEEARLTTPDGGGSIEVPDPTDGPAGFVALDSVASLGVRAVGQLVVRAIATRAITLVGTIALARLLTPEDFGVFALVTFLVVLLTLVGDVGLGGALIQQPSHPTDRELATVFTFQAALWSTVLVAVWVLAAVLPVLAPELPPSTSTLARLLGVAACVSGLRSVPSVMLTRVLRFGPLAVMEVVQQVVYFGLAVALAMVGFGVVSFGVAAAVQSVIATIGLWLIFGRWPGFGFDVAVARRMWGFGFRYQLSNVFYWTRDSVVAIFGGLAGGLQGIGFIQFGWRNGQFAISIEEIVARVAFPAFSRLQGDPSRLAPIATTSIEGGFLAVAIIQGWLAATASTLVPIVFSDQWTPAILVFQLVCIGSLAWGPVLILRALVFARGQSRLGLRLAAFNIVLIFVLFPILTIAFGLAGAGVAFAVSAVGALLAYVWATRDVLVFPWPSIARILAEMVVASVVAFVVVGMVNGVPGLLVSGVAYTATFGLLVLVFQRDLLARTRLALNPAPDIGNAP